MLIPLSQLVKKYNIQFKGVLHVGAHECEELGDYEQYIQRSKILWIEAMENKVEANYEHLLIENAVISDKEETLKFNVSNNGQSSSLLELGLHKQFHPHIHYVDFFMAKTQLLKDILPKYEDIHFNFLNLDIQGAELKALKSMGDYLNNVDYIYTEVNSDYVYEDCALITELDDYLSQFKKSRDKMVRTFPVGRRVLYKTN